MNLGWIWPRITDKASAGNAIAGGFCCMFIVVANAGMGIYALAAHQKVGGYYGAGVFVDAILFAVIGWRLRKNSRTWAVIGLALMGVEIIDKLQNAASTFGVITALLFLSLLNATRGTFAFHKYNEQEAALAFVHGPNAAKQ
jgi:hypothetical protein